MPVHVVVGVQFLDQRHQLVFRDLLGQLAIIRRDSGLRGRLVL
jgi:hypothetical protein